MRRNAKEEIAYEIKTEKKSCESRAKSSSDLHGNLGWADEENDLNKLS